MAAPVMAGDAVDTSFVEAQGPHPFSVRYLVMMDRVSDPQLSPDGHYAAFGVRSTDYSANKGVSAVHRLDLSGKDAQPVNLLDKASLARWSSDGRSLYYVAAVGGMAQLYSIENVAALVGARLRAISFSKEKASRASAPTCGA